ncbi:hypothetical protein BDF20DRAFT_203778 [Mycotypha africana]|uniref:uncharacterized protein n=1 Tax=Mycotypha africana TaxID=64632 RepID=UPI002301E29A|nr:uncharacterized protein BDF20DRAFT_203778 [Mycotypha africana]KAI8968029.1 hypothetical protein BDF20DRAFT_203778 [Mycotypha africana]
MEDAINQLQVLGVTRGQAKRALARYNNDVARAADYIFSGAELSDEDDEDYNNDMNIDASVIDEKMETDKEMAIRFSLEEQENHTTAPKAYLDKAATFTSQKPAAAPDWSVVPFTAKEPNVTSIPPSSSSSSFSAASSHSTMTAQTSVAGRYNSLTWWSDPENPNERKALRNIPIGLRPPSSNCAYSPILIQALFHITAFQQLILAYRPIPYTYGGDHAHASTSKEYWRGYGEPVPGYILREVKTKVPIVKSTSGTDYSLSTTAPTLPIASEIPTSIIPTESVSSANSHYSNTDYITDKTVDNLVNVDVAVDTMQKLTLHEDNSFNNDNLTDWNIEHMDTPFNETITSTPFASNIEEVEYEERYENELQCVPKSVQALAELQKIFGFLGFSKRRYGNIAHFTRALNASGQEASVAIHMPRTSLNNNSRLDWKYNEKSFDGK